MNKREFTWCGHTWITEERWGDCHPEKSFVVYDGNMVRPNDDGSIALYVSKLGDKYSVGLISCMDKLGYGTYELDVKFPSGRNLWPAFWSWSWGSWPPEIDVFEGYSESDCYNKNGLLHDIRPNVHYGESSESHHQKGAIQTPAILTYNPTENFIHFTCKYTSKSISIFYNHVLVYYVCSKKIMKWFNKHIEQNVIINVSVEEKFTDADLNDFRPMVIKNFKYTKK